MGASLWLRRFVSVIAAATLWAVAVGYASGAQKALLKKGLQQQRDLPQMRYHGGPKSPMWRG